MAPKPRPSPDDHHGVSRFAATLRITGLCIVGSVAYGVVHDLFTAHVCLEYFTIGHPRLFASDAPWLHALAWGVIATWWVGLGLGLGLSFAALAGRRPPRTAGSLIRPIAALLGGVGALAAAAGIVAHVAAEAGHLQLAEFWSEQIEPARAARFLSVAVVHSTSYVAGVLGMVGLGIWVWRSRRPPGP